MIELDTTAEKTGEIYCISWDSGCYVGQSRVGSLRRWKMHIWKLSVKRHHNSTLQRIFDSSGLTSLSFRVLETQIPISRLDEKEEYWTKMLSSCNILPKKIIKRNKRNVIYEMLSKGMTYRAISKAQNVSLGSISYIREEYMRN